MSEHAPDLDGGARISIEDVTELQKAKSTLFRFTFKRGALQPITSAFLPGHHVVPVVFFLC